MQKFVLSSCDMFCCHWMLMCEAQGRRQEAGTGTDTDTDTEFLRSVTWEKTWQPCDLLSTGASVSVVSLHPHLWITTAVYYSSAPDTEESNHGWGVKWMKKNCGGGSCWITLRSLSSLESKHIHDFMAIIHCWDWFLYPCHDSSMWQVHMNADHSSRCSNKVFPMVTRTGLTKCN